MKPEIMVVEDDRYLREELLHTLAKVGAVTALTSFEAVEQTILHAQPDLVVLDINLPFQTGFDICRYLKARSAFPILMLTARDELHDELQALALGADDYLTKPCHPQRLLARVERLLQTYRKVQHLIQAGDFFLDTDTYKFIWAKQTLVLPETEGRILQVLFENFPAIVPKATIIEAVWGTAAFVDENILQVNILRLRKNLQTIGLASLIHNVRGKGYCLKLPES